MDKEKRIAELTAGMDRRTKRYKKTVEYMRTKPYPGKEKIGTYNPTEDYDYGLQEAMELKSCFCPCAICGHEFMWECDEENCECCGSACC